MNKIFSMNDSTRAPLRMKQGEGAALRRISLAMVVGGTLALVGCSADSPSPVVSPDAGAAIADDHGHDDDHADSLELSAEARAVAGLVVVPAGPAVLRERLTLYGLVRPDAERVRDVTARFPGVVRSVNVRIGDAVRQGATLATVESNESLQTYAVSSPLRGVVTERATNPGEQAQSLPLFTVVDLSAVWVELALYPRERSQVHPGQIVNVKTTDGGISGTGKIVFVSPLGAAQTQSLTVRVALDNADGRWSPGLYVAGEVIVGDQSLPLAVPEAALQDLDGRVSVFVETAHGFQARAVTVGRSDARWWRFSPA